jgi:2-polyprenyl-3-methyl-5-hydroxy-6-metoxy-1,4-benzoquinol methylase
MEGIEYARVCEVCGGDKFDGFVSARKIALERCRKCSFERRKNIPTEKELTEFYAAQYYHGWGIEGSNPWGRDLKQKTFQRVLRKAEGLISQKDVLLDIGCGTGLLMEAAQELGWTSYGIDISDYGIQVAQKMFGTRAMQGSLSEAPIPGQPFQVITLIDLLEHIPKPNLFLDVCREKLTPDGLLLIGTPNLKSLSARTSGRFWHHYKQEHLYYWSPQTIRLFLQKHGFKVLEIKPYVKTLNLAYIFNQLEKYPLPGLTSCIKKISRALPAPISLRPFQITIGEMFVIARRA